MIYEKRGIAAQMPQFLDNFLKKLFYNRITSNSIQLI